MARLTYDPTRKTFNFIVDPKRRLHADALARSEGSSISSNDGGSGISLVVVVGAAVVVVVLMVVGRLVLYPSIHPVPFVSVINNCSLPPPEPRCFVTATSWSISGYSAMMSSLHL